MRNQGEVVVSRFVRTMIPSLVQMKEGSPTKRKNQREDDGHSNQSTHGGIVREPVGCVNEAKNKPGMNATPRVAAARRASDKNYSFGPLRIPLVPRSDP